MKILTDSPRRAAAFFGLEPAALRPARSPPPEGFGAVAAAFFGEERPRELFHLDERRWPGELFPLLLFQERAGRSNLDVLGALERKGAAPPHGFVAAAAAGAGFLGRFDRSWRCLPGNLHAVIRLEPRLPPERAGPAFSILAAAACVDALRLAAPEKGEGPGPGEAEEAKGGGAQGERSAPDPASASGPGAGQGSRKGASASIKWINDVCIGKAKVAGFLTRQTYQAPLITGVSLGIGVNVLAAPALAPDPFVPAAASLASLMPCRKWTPGLFLAALLERLRLFYERLLDEGPAELLAFYRRHSNVLNRAVGIYEDGFGFGEGGPGERRLLGRGVVEEIGDDLSLKLAGVPEPLSAGRLAFEEDMTAGSSREKPAP